MFVATMSMVFGLPEHDPRIEESHKANGGLDVALVPGSYWVDLSPFCECFLSFFTQSKLVEASCGRYGEWVM